MRTLVSVLVSLLLVIAISSAQQKPLPRQAIHEIVSLPERSATEIAITDVTLIDGRGGSPLKHVTVIVRNGSIAAIGKSQQVAVPPKAEVFPAEGLTMLPGLMDAHFHLDGAHDLPSLFLRHGITSVRDPGAWMEAYEPVIKAEGFKPRLFLAGPHLDSPPPAYPHDALIVRDNIEARQATNWLIDSGATVIKVYFRLPLGLIETIVQTAHARGIPVTAHLETVDAGNAIRAGLDGIEHVTSLGSALLPPRDAEAYRQSVLADNQARREGRYKVWSELDLTTPRTRELIELMKQRKIFLSPTLAVFERRTGDRESNATHVRGFQQMLNFVGLAYRGGVRIVVGSHSDVPHAEKGWAYHRELELLVESGLTPMAAIEAGTIQNARFFQVDGRLGSIEPGKRADLILVEGNPSEDISALRHVKRVMINGLWLP